MIANRTKTGRTNIIGYNIAIIRKVVYLAKCLNLSIMSLYKNDFDAPNPEEIMLENREEKNMRNG